MLYVTSPMTCMEEWVQYNTLVTLHYENNFQDCSHNYAHIDHYHGTTVSVSCCQATKLPHINIFIQKCATELSTIQP